MYTVSRTAACAAFVKSFHIVLFIATVLNAGQGWGQSAGFNNTFIILSLNGGANTFYDLNATTANADFNNANLGTFAAGSSNLTLKGAEHNVFKCGGADLTSTRLYYRIYPTASPSGSFTSQTIGFTSGFNNGCGGQDQVWSNTGLTINLLTGLGAGNYTIEVYSDATITCCGGTAFASNSGNNYKATFTVSSIDWVENGTSTPWYTAANWSPSTASGAWLAGSHARFLNTGTATTAGIAMNTASLSIGAIEITSARTRVLTIGNSATNADGTLTLNGLLVNGTSNVILRNNASSSNLLTIQNNQGSGNRTLTVALGNSTTNVIDAASPITISSNITGVSRSITKIGTGTLTLSGTNTYSGGTIISGGTVSAGAAANLGDAAGAITLGSGSTSATLAATGTFTRNALNVTTSSAAGVIDVATSQTLTIGALNTASGTDNTTKIGKSGAGTLTLSGAGSYVGQTQIGQGTVIVSNNSGLGTNNTTTARGIDLGLNVGDVSQANNVSVLATTGITVPQSIYVAPNTSSATRTVGVNGSGSATFSNEIYMDGSLTALPGLGNSLTLSGRLTFNGGLLVSAGTTLLTASNNNYTGTTTINANGDLRLNPSANASFSSQIILNGGTLSTTGITATRTWTNTSTLNLSASSTIALGTGDHTLTFANSNGVSWTAATILNITGWVGTAGNSGTSGKIFLGSNSIGLTATQLEQITFSGFAPGALLLANGELVPRPCTAGAASSTPTLCINTALTNITHTTTGATGISNAGVSGANGLPTGVSASWASNTITISGTPTAPGTFNYSIPLTGGCGSVNATGTIIVTPTVTINAFSPATSTRCQGAGTVTTTTTASNSTGITYSIDGTSSTGGVTINASTGAVTYPAGWSGTTTITASAAGCNGPVTTTHVVTTTPTVGTPTAITVSSGTEPSCQLTNGTTTTTYATTATNSTGFNWSVSPAG
ncbi:MAG: beta strand repeat-containing protein, partial [Flavobacteriales bacterium]